MKHINDSPQKRGRKPTGRVTVSTQLRLELNIRDRVDLEATTTGQTKIQVVEKALDSVLPKIPSCL